MSLAGRLVGRTSRVLYASISLPWHLVRNASPIRKFGDDAFCRKSKYTLHYTALLLQLHAASDRNLQVENWYTHWLRTNQFDLRSTMYQIRGTRSETCTIGCESVRQSDMTDRRSDKSCLVVRTDGVVNNIQQLRCLDQRSGPCHSNKTSLSRMYDTQEIRQNKNTVTVSVWQFRRTLVPGHRVPLYHAVSIIAILFITSCLRKVLFWNVAWCSRRRFSSP